MSLADLWRGMTADGDAGTDTRDGEGRRPTATFDHAGVAAEDAEAVATLYEDLLGLPRVHEETFDGMRVVFLSTDPGYFEILEPLDGGPVARYLESEGSGVHHLAVRVENVDRALSWARTCDVTPIDDEGRPGAWGHRVAFLHPQDTAGVLLEFVEAGHTE